LGRAGHSAGFSCAWETGCSGVGRGFGSRTSATRMAPVWSTAYTLQRQPAAMIFSGKRMPPSGVRSIRQKLRWAVVAWATPSWHAQAYQPDKPSGSGSFTPRCLKLYTSAVSPGHQLRAHSQRTVGGNIAGFCPHVDWRAR
jgi:hypothetical protein